MPELMSTPEMPIRVTSLLVKIMFTVADFCPPYSVDLQVVLWFLDSVHVVYLAEWCRVQLL